VESNLDVLKTGNRHQARSGIQPDIFTLELDRLMIAPRLVFGVATTRTVLICLKEILESRPEVSQAVPENLIRDVVKPGLNVLESGFVL
jgi:hypothetical protein